MTTPEYCAARAGVYQGDGTTCGGDPCARGACCHSGGACDLLTTANCAMLGGVFRGVGQPCGEPGCGDSCGTIRRGDADADGVVNNFDVDGFILGRSQPDVFLALYCYGGENCYLCRLDMDRSGMVNSFDIDPFVECLMYGRCP